MTTNHFADDFTWTAIRDALHHDAELHYVWACVDIGNAGPCGLVRCWTVYPDSHYDECLGSMLDAYPGLRCDPPEEAATDPDYEGYVDGETARWGEYWIESQYWGFGSTRLGDMEPMERLQLLSDVGWFERSADAIQGHIVHIHPVDDPVVADECPTGEGWVTAPYQPTDGWPTVEAAKQYGHLARTLIYAGHLIPSGGAR